MRVAIVVGASSGLGHAVASKLAAEGIRTYAGARSFGIRKEPPEGCVPITLDVTDETAVQAAISHVLKTEGRIDILVNCAAFLTLGACEETSIEELQAVLQTNFIGMVRVTQAVLPIMRAQCAGHIIQFSSLNGLVAIPFQSAYIASKHAIEGWSEALAMEVRPFGISVTIMEPGDCSGGSDAYRLHAGAARHDASPYHHAYLSAVHRIHQDETHGQSPARIANAVYRVLTKKRPPVRVAVAKIDQRLAVWLHDLLPTRFFAWCIRVYYTPKHSAINKKQFLKEGRNDEK